MKGLPLWSSFPYPEDPFNTMEGIRRVLAGDCSPVLLKTVQTRDIWEAVTVKETWWLNGDGLSEQEKDARLRN